MRSGAKSRTVIETFRGYADLEIAGAYPAMLSDFDRSMDEIIRVRQRNATIAALPPMFTEVGLPSAWPSSWRSAPGRTTRK